MGLRSALVLGTVLAAWPMVSRAEGPPLAEYFRAETARIASQPLEGIDSAEDWKARRPELKRQMLEMLGLWPLPEKTDLHIRKTGTLDRPDFIVEKLVFQSLPGLYVTGNLYRPKEVKEPLPAILYVCGHAKVEKDGVIYGCKTHYQHHPEWYAANGFVCLVIDTLQLGEVPGLHHGTFREGMWWWYSRGYTPAGIEAWNGIRAIDYLCSRPEVDPKRLGVTGRSGGGATSWWLGAIEDRLAAVIPVAGITDLQDHVVGGDFPGPHTDGVIQGHCDCMFIVNTYRWDYPTVAALVAPKALLVENTDADPIFPEGGVRRVYDQLKKVYGWYEAEDKLGIVIGSGGHADTEELRHPSFAFMQKWLQGKEVNPNAISEPDRKIPIEELKVLQPGETLADSRNATIHESFIQPVEPPPVLESKGAWEVLQQQYLEALKSKVFAGWPDSDAAGSLDVKPAYDVTRSGVGLRAFDFQSQPGVTLRLWQFSDPEAPKTERTLLVVLDPKHWEKCAPLIQAFESEDGDPSKEPEFDRLRDYLRDGTVVALLAPRGVGPTAWPAKKDTHIRRRFYLLGQTLGGMRVWDARRALHVLKGDSPKWLMGIGDSAPLALWAAVFEPEVQGVVLIDPPTTVEDGPAFLNLSRVLDMPQAVALLAPRKVRLRTSQSDAWKWTTDLASRLFPDQDWLEIRPRKSEGSD